MRDIPTISPWRCMHEFGNVGEALKECDYVRTDHFENKKQDGAFSSPRVASPSTT